MLSTCLHWEETVKCCVWSLLPHTSLSFAFSLDPFAAIICDRAYKGFAEFCEAV